MTLVLPAQAPVLTAQALAADPQPAWAWLREHAPVCSSPDLGLVLVTRHDDVERVTRDAETFSANVPSSPLVRTVGENLLHEDGVEHARLRALISPLLRVGTVRTTYGELLRDEASRLLAQGLQRGRLEVMQDLAGPLAELLLLRLMGLPEQEPGILDAWFRGIGEGASNFEQDPAKQARADAASAAVDDALRSSVEHPAPEASLIGLHRSGAMTFAELASTAKLFVIGGLQEPRDLLGLAVVALLRHPDQLAAVLERPALLPKAIEEAARWESPVGTVTRTTTHDVELSGTLVPKGTVVAGVLASANRDPRRWQDPEQFRVERDEGMHLGFAAGAHLCVGAAAARLLVREAMVGLLPTLGDAVLEQEPVLRGYEFRGPDAVLLSWPQEG